MRRREEPFPCLYRSFDVIVDEEMGPTLLVFVICLSCCGSLASGKLTCDPVDSSSGASCEPASSYSGCDGEHVREDEGDPEMACFGPNYRSFLCSDGINSDLLKCSTDRSECHTSETNDHRTSDGVSYTFEPVNVRYFKLCVRLPPEGIEEYEVRVNYDGEAYSKCSSEKTYNLTLEYLYSTEPPMQLRVLAGGSVVYDQQLDYPNDCADNINIAYDITTCGLPQLQSPPKIVMKRNRTHTTVSWDKAVSYISPISGDEVLINISTFYLTVKESGQRFKVCDATKVAINITTPINVLLHAFDTCSGIYEFRHNTGKVVVVGLSLPTTCNISDTPQAVCGEIAPPVSITPSPIKTPSIISQPTLVDGYIPVYIAAGIAGGVLILVAVVTALIIAIVKGCHSKGGHARLQGHTPSPSPPPQHSALVFYSPGTSEQEKRVIMQTFAIIHHLPDQSGFESYLQVTRRPQQTLVNWINLHHDKAQAVILVCNNVFKSEWEAIRPSPEVQTLRLLFEGQLSSKERKRYAIVLTKPSDEVFIPSLLKALPRFNLFDTVALVQYVRNEESPV